jgi:hypothetical protein
VGGTRLTIEIGAEFPIGITDAGACATSQIRLDVRPDDAVLSRELHRANGRPLTPSPPASIPTGSPIILE